MCTLVFIGNTIRHNRQKCAKQKCPNLNFLFVTPNYEKFIKESLFLYIKVIYI